MARKRNPHRRPHERRHLHAVPDLPSRPRHDRADEFIAGVRMALRAESPAALLELVSAIIELTDDSVATVEGESANRADLVEAFVATPVAETTALLTLMAHLLPHDEPLIPLVTAEAERRRHPMPPWIRELRADNVTLDVYRMTEEFEDGENCVIGVDFGGAAAVTVIVFVDHNLMSAVKDAFVVPQPVADVLTLIRSGDLPGPIPDRIDPYDAADARMNLGIALVKARLMEGMPEQESWPGTRPLVEWLVDAMPRGGHADEDPEWTEAQSAALRREFLASPHGKHLVGDKDADYALDLILEFGEEYNFRGPLRWSPVVVERFLLDFIPDMVPDPYDEVAAVPSVLFAWVKFVHEREGVAHASMSETLWTLSEREAAFEEVMGAGDFGIGEVDMNALVLKGIATMVGGTDALAAMDVRPLPDEGFRWEGIAPDIRGRVQAHLDLLDEAADTHLDVEFRTAFRRFLAAVAVDDPWIFRRKSSDATGAAAVAWAVCSGNDKIGYRGDLTATEVASWFGVTGSSSQRAQPMLAAAGAPPGYHYGKVPLGSAEFLVSAQRATLIEIRDAHY